MQVHYLITFESTHHAIHVEKLLKDRFAIELIPTPREITASCGLSLRFEVADYGGIAEALEDDDKIKTKLYEWTREGKARSVAEMQWR